MWLGELVPSPPCTPPHRHPAGEWHSGSRVTQRRRLEEPWFAECLPGTWSPDACWSWKNPPQPLDSFDYGHEKCTQKCLELKFLCQISIHTIRV